MDEPFIPIYRPPLLNFERKDGRDRFKETFITRLPEVSHLREQNVVNQYRVIEKNDRIGLLIRQQIFHAVFLELGVES